MSHIHRRIATKGQSISNLAAVNAAAERCGMVFHEGAKKFTGYRNAQHPCEHKIAPLPGDVKTIGNYEIGLVPSKALESSFDLEADFYGGLADKVGDDFGRLMQFYHLESAKTEARNQGLMFQEITQENGFIRLEVDTTVKLGY